jgi:hypothetical protein
VVVGVTEPPQQRPQPGEQLLEGERLDEVVVGTGVEPFDPVGGAGAGGEHEDRHPVAFAAHDAAHRQAVEHGHADVEDDDVGGSGAHLLQRRRPVDGGDDVVPLEGQGALHRSPHGRIVIGHQHPAARGARRCCAYLPGNTRHRRSLPQRSKSRV